MMAHFYAIAYLSTAWAAAVMTPQVVSEALSEVNNFNGSKCDSCKNVLSVLQRVAKGNSGLLPTVLAETCLNQSVIMEKDYSICSQITFYTDVNGTYGMNSYLPTLTNVLALMDVEKDGDLFCSRMWGSACSDPVLPKFNSSEWWPSVEESEVGKLATSKNSTFRALHLSDVHLSMNYSESASSNCGLSMCCVDKFPADPKLPPMLAPKWGYYGCDAPQALLDNVLDDVKTRNTYDFAIFTGDMVDHDPVLDDLNSTYYEETSVLQAMKNALGGVPVYPVLGNHDTFPYGQEPPLDSPYANATAGNYAMLEPLWRDWLGNSSNQAVTQHGAYVVHPKPGLKIITINSNYWYHSNLYLYANTSDLDPSGGIRFAINELLDCERQGTKAWVQTHVPTGGDSTEALPGQSRLVTAMLERFSKNIAGLFYGHTHVDEFTVLYGNNATSRDYDNAIGVAWVAPSITPWTDYNPAWRWYEVDSDTFEIMDAITVYAPIEGAFNVPWSDAPNLVWSEEYSARKAYGRAWPENEPLNGKFWHLVAAQILSESKYAQEFVNRAYRYSLHTADCSTEECRIERYCYATSMSVQQVKSCQSALGMTATKRMSSVPQWPMPRASRNHLEKVASI